MLARAMHSVEEAVREDTDEFGNHRPRAMTKASLDMMDLHEVREATGMTPGFQTFDLPIDDRKDERGFPLHIWHPYEGRYVPAEFDDDGNLTSPVDLVEMLLREHTEPE